MKLGLLLAVAMTMAPRPVPPAYVSEQYGLTFRTPTGGAYCPLPEHWGGADHGTVIFLRAPSRCGDAGFPSSGRSFKGDPPRIEVFYSYYDEDDDRAQAPVKCHEIGRVVFLGKTIPLCHEPSRHGVRISASARYKADNPVQTVLTLQTSPSRLKADLSRFSALLRSASMCTATWHSDKGDKPFTTGAGPPCPDDARWF